MRRGESKPTVRFALHAVTRGCKQQRFRSLRPDHPLGTPGGWGAWEIKARYSDIDLDYLPFNTAATGGVAGGKQDVWSVGLNWYPTNGLRFALDYDNIQVNHANAPATDISASAIALRSQISF